MSRQAARWRATAITALALAVMSFPAVPGASAWVIAATLVLCLLGAAIAIHDLTTMLIPDRYTLGIALVGMVDWWLGAGGLDELWWRAGLAVAVMAVLWLIDICYGLMRGRAGIGLGDVKLIGASAMLIGISGVGAQIVLAAVAAFIFVVLRSVRRRRPLRAVMRVPFGTFLAPALVIVWAWLPSAW